MEQSINSYLDWFTAADWRTYQWEQFKTISDFKWTVGVTPFSHLQVPVIIGVFYLVSIYLLQNWMKDRKAFVLKGVTFVHNMILSALSLAMFLGAAYGAMLKYNSQGFWAGLVCEQEKQPIHGVLFYWSYIFYLSKFYELVDTYLLALKKKPIIFLHIFHHFVMPFVCWHGLEGKWCMALWTSTFWNSFVHVFMYYYYAVSTIGIHPWWKKYLTMLQIYQFVSGVFYTWVYFYYYLKDATVTIHDDYSITVQNQGCTGDLKSIIFMFAVNVSFLFLFTKFYLSTYKQPRGKSSVPKNKTQ